VEAAEIVREYTDDSTDQTEPEEDGIRW